MHGDEGKKDGWGQNKQTLHAFYDKPNAIRAQYAQRRYSSMRGSAVAQIGHLPESGLFQLLAGIGGHRAGLIGADGQGDGPVSR